MIAAVARNTVLTVAIAAALLLGEGAQAEAIRGGSPAVERECTASETRQLVRTSVSAFNRGDSAQLNRLFAPASRFKWYSTGGPGRRLGSAAHKRGTLIHYFAARHAERERLTLIGWRGGGNANGYFHFQFLLIREARDLRPMPYQGKGAAICSSANTIAVWSMAPRR